MSKMNRLFPAWRKTKKGERMPGSYPLKSRFVFGKPKPVVVNTDPIVFETNEEIDNWLDGVKERMNQEMKS